LYAEPNAQSDRREEVNLIVDVLLHHYSHASIQDLQTCAARAPDYGGVLQDIAARRRRPTIRSCNRRRRLLPLSLNFNLTKPRQCIHCVHSDSPSAVSGVGDL
jgi:hypothetical protein